MSSTPNDNEFTKLGSFVYLRRPTQPVKDDNAPNIIIVFGWMGAQLRHIHKYTQVYEQMYPGATQIVIMSAPHFFWSSEKTLIKAITPAVETLEALGIIPGQSTTVSDPIPRILAHAFSNGGSYNMITLGKALSMRYPPTTPLPVSAVIIDSAPGGGGLKNAVDAFTSHISTPVKRLIFKALITALYVFGYILGPLIGRKTTLQKIEYQLGNRRLLPWAHKDTPRLYLYSKKDNMVPWTDTQAHLFRCEQLGLNTTSILFENSPHVAHARAYPKRYWEAVATIWEAATLLPLPST